MAEIKLGGRVYELKFNYRALRALEDYYNKPMDQIFNGKESQKLETISVFLYACLKKQVKSISPDKIDDLIDEGIEKGELEFKDLNEAFKKAIEESTLIKQLQNLANEAEAKN